MFTCKSTAIILMLLLRTAVISASFKDCKGDDFVSRQCTEDGETIAPLLTEHEHPAGIAEVSHQLQRKSIPGTSSILNTATKDGTGGKSEEVLEGFKPRIALARKQPDDKVTPQPTSTIRKLPDMQVLVHSIPKSKITPDGEAVASVVDSLDKQNEDIAREEAKFSRNRLQASANSLPKPSNQHLQGINNEISISHSEKLLTKPSSQSFTQKLHYAITKLHRESSSTAADISKKSPKMNSNESSDKERSVNQNRILRSVPEKDLIKISQNSASSNGLRKQSSLTVKEYPVEKTMLKEVKEEHGTEIQNVAIPFAGNTFGSEQQNSQASETERGAGLENTSQGNFIKHLLNNQSQVTFDSKKLKKPQNELDTGIKNYEPIHVPDVFATKSTSVASNRPKNSGGTPRSSIQNRIRRSAFEEENSSLNEAAATMTTLMATATSFESPVTAVTNVPTTSETVAEQGFTRLPEICHSVSSSVAAVDENVVRQTTPEKSDLKCTIKEQSYNSLDHKSANNNDRQSEKSETTEAQNGIPPGVDYGKLRPPDTQAVLTDKKSILETTSADITNLDTLDFPEINGSPKAESLVYDLQHERNAKVSQEWKDLAREVEAVNPLVVIHKDNRDHDADYGVNDERSRPTQRLPASKLAFPSIPQGEAFHIQDLGLSEGLFVFSYLSSFLSWIQPYDFPVELLRDALWKRVSIVDLITESLQVEVGFIACLTIGVLLALGVPCILVVHGCCRMFDSKNSTDSWNEQQDAETCAGNCHRVTLVFIMQLVLVLLVAGIVSMFVTNEQMSHAVEQTPTALHTALNDVNTFLRNSHQQLRFVATKTLDQAVDAIVTELDDIEELLGRPIQDQIATETGVDIALDALVDVSAEARAISSKVEALLSNAASTRDLIVDSRERLADLRLQVDLFRRQCPSRFRPLCDTVDTTGLDVVLRIESLMTEHRLTRLRDLRDGNLTLVAQQARGEFQYVPMRVEKETKDSRNAIKRQLARQKEDLYDSAWSLDVLSRDLSFRVEEARNKAMQFIRGIGDVEQWRWLTGLGAASSVLFLWLLLLTGVTCGCCGVENRGGSTLLASVVLMSIFSVGLWALALSALLVGGHGEVFICRPLYDEPGYAALTRLVDRPGVLFQRSSGGFFSNLLYGNGTLDVPLRDVLEECKADGPAYQAFRLRQVFDVDMLSDHRRWENVHTELRRLRVDLSDMRLLTPELQAQLQEMLVATTVNLTNYRAQISRQVTGRDLGSFADQLSSVANQITDLSTLSRLETLASRTRRLLASHILPLEQRKEDLVYQLTALEVQMAPLQRQVNQSLSHLRTIQFFIDNKAGNISAQKSEDYIARLVGYMDQFRDYVLNATKNFVAPCRPIWNLYHAMRVLFCRHVMDPLNGFWFATVWCLLLFIVATPPCLKLADHYRHLKMQHQHNSSLLTPSTERQLMHVKEKVSMNRSPSETLMISDQGGNWSTPGSGEPDGW